MKFILNILRTQGVKGLMAYLQLWRAQRDIGSAYEQIEREMELHERMLRELQLELAQAQRDFREANRVVGDLVAQRGAA